MGSAAEIVRGARVEGRAPGESRVEFALAVPLPGRARIRYKASAPVDPSGRYEIRLPYATEAGYAVRAGQRRGSLELSEVGVRGGRTVQKGAQLGR